MNLNAMLIEWRMARRHGYARELVKETVADLWEQFWLCRVRRQHREKFGSWGRCVRCGKHLR